MDTKFSAGQIRQVLGSAEGKRLIAMLSENGKLQAAAEAWKRGDAASAQELLAPTLKTQEAEELLRKINGK